MMRTTHVAYSASLLMLLALAPPLAAAQEAEAQEAEAIVGTFALAGAEATTSGEMTVTETSPLTLELEVTFTSAASGEVIRDFTEELTQELHLLAVDSTLTKLVHEHVKSADAEGGFAAEMKFPTPGLYHIYADAVPAGFGQQVLRFDVDVPGQAGAADLPAPEHTAGHDTVAVSGEYSIEIDPTGLRPLQTSAIAVSILKGGEPAPDLAPYLGVAAHAVLIRAEDLSYIHAHPSSAEEGGGHAAHGAASTPDAGHAAPPADANGGHAAHGAASAPAADHAAPPADANGGHAAHGAASTPDGGHAAPMADAHGDHGPSEAEAAVLVEPEMELNVTPPGPGEYALFIQFMGGEDVHTAVFSLEVEPDATR